MVLNQYEKSVNFIKENVSVFVRKAFAEFGTSFKYLQDVFKATFEDAPSSTANVVDGLICGEKRYWQVLSSILFKVEPYKIEQIIRNMTITTHKKSLSSEEFFYTLSRPDIYAPVREIKAQHTYMYPVGINNTSLPLIFQTSTNFFKNKVYNEYDITGINGEVTKLDFLSSELIIDVGSIFDAFFTAIKEKLRTYYDDSDKDDSDKAKESQYENFINIERVDEVEGITENVDKIIVKLTGSAITTYLVYASKLMGAKTDTLHWAYSSFVKDSVGNLEMADYPTKAPVTQFSGHAFEGETSATNHASQIGENNLNMASNNYFGTNADDKAHKAFIYRSIRLQYSHWAVIMNAILGESKRNDLKGDFYDKNKLLSYDNETLNKEHLKVASNVLLAYISAKYRTVNSFAQFSENGIPYQSSSRIKIGSSQIKDADTVKIIKESVKGFVEGQVFIRFSTEDFGFNELNNLAIKKLSELFMHYAYVIMLDSTREKLSGVKDEIEPVTGKSKVDLFNEIYYGIITNINRIIKGNDKSVGEVFNALSSNNNLLSDIDAINALASPYTTFTQETYEKFSDSYGRMSAALSDVIRIYKQTQKHIPWDNYFEFGTSSFIKEILLIPFVSEVSGIEVVVSNKTEYYTDASGAASLDARKTNVLFPKNAAVVEFLSKSKKAFNRSFRTLESINATLDELEYAFEGADCMANNANYNALASLGSSVQSLEVKDYMQISNHVSDEPVSGNIDNDGYAIKERPTDQEDQLDLMTPKSTEAVHADILARIESEQAHRTLKRYYEIFNKAVLDYDK